MTERSRERHPVMTRGPQRCGPLVRSRGVLADAASGVLADLTDLAGILTDLTWILTRRLPGVTTASGRAIRRLEPCGGDAQECADAHADQPSDQRSGGSIVLVSVPALTGMLPDLPGGMLARRLLHWVLLHRLLYRSLLYGSVVLHRSLLNGISHHLSLVRPCCARPSAIPAVNPRDQRTVSVYRLHPRTRSPTTDLNLAISLPSASFPVAARPPEQVGRKPAPSADYLPTCAANARGVRVGSESGRGSGCRWM